MAIVVVVLLVFGAAMFALGAATRSWRVPFLPLGLAVILALLAVVTHVELGDEHCAYECFEVGPLLFGLGSVGSLVIVAPAALGVAVGRWGVGR